ncbi:MAG: hypothetical protein MK096_12905 [Oleiphilaceae bacterium]|nr:hypothetical protein [Oleiphilaceae bacterium]
MSGSKNIKEAEVIKAGCGIRYDPEQLGTDTEFDFSAAQDLLKPEELNDGKTANESNKKNVRESPNSKC